MWGGAPSTRRTRPLLQLLEEKGRLHGKIPKKFGHGGPRTKKAAPEALWQHPHAASAAKDALRASKKAYYGGWVPSKDYGPAAH